MSEIILYALSTIGLTNILIYGSILDTPRKWIRERVSKKVQQGMECYQCVGTWAGLFTGLSLLRQDVVGVIMCAFAGGFIANFAALVVDYIEANSMVPVVVNEETDDMEDMEDTNFMHIEGD